MGMSMDSPGYGVGVGTRPQEKRSKIIGDWTPEETNWTNIWLRKNPYVRSKFCERCIPIVIRLSDYEGRGQPGWTPHQGGILPLKSKIWKDLVLSAIQGCHLCSLAIGSSWNAGSGPFDIFRWIRCADRTGELEMAQWNPQRFDEVDATDIPAGRALCGLQFGEELTFDAADDRETAWSNIWLFERDQPRRSHRLGFALPSTVEDQPPAPMCLSTGDAESLQLASWWLRRCKTEHAACSAAVNIIGLDWPARLLYVGLGKGDEDLRIDPNTDPHWRPEYVALSYCWGATKFQHLTRENISAYSSKIDYAELPKTLQDAIDVSRQLGISYLWVDALCIIQDSKEDWATESVKMGQVYRQAVLTIAALGAPECSRGCFLPRNPLCLRDCPIPGTQLRLSSTAWTMKREYQIRGRFASPLQTRAWVVQEEYSATRTLYFGSAGLWWQCITCEATESQPFGDKSQAVAGDGTPEGRFKTIISPNGFAENIKYLINQVLTADKASPTRIKEFLSLWHDILERYTSCKLTYQSDKLVAISGIVGLFKKTLGLEYKVGLWVEKLATELLWSSVTRSDNEPVSPKRSTSRAPSFSWASVEQPVHPFVRSSTIELEAKSIELIEQTHEPDAHGKGVALKVVSQLKRVWLIPNGHSTAKESAALFVFADEGEIEPPAETELDVQLDGDNGRSEIGYLVLSRRKAGESLRTAASDPVNPQKRVTYSWVPDISLDEAPIEAWYLCIVRYAIGDFLVGTAGLMLTPVDSSRHWWSRIGFMIHETMPLYIGENLVTSTEDQSGRESQRLTDRSHSKNPFQVDSGKEFGEVLIV